MAILPGSRIERLEYIESKVPIWTSASALIGLSAPQLVLLSAQTSACRTAYQAMVAAQQASKNATQAFYNSCATMTDTTSDYLKVIKGFAAATNNPAVYTIASIPPNKTPAPLPPPTTPTNLTATLLNNGAIKIEWKASVENTSFSIWRKLNLTGQAYEQVGVVSSARAFTDATLLAGALGSAGPGVFYQIQAHRNGLNSEFSEPVSIRFGSVDGEGGGSGELKMAA